MIARIADPAAEVALEHLEEAYFILKPHCKDVPKGTVGILREYCTLYRSDAAARAPR